MKFSDLVKLEPEFLRPPEAAVFLGSQQILDDLVQAGWLKPAMSRKRLTIYSVKSLRACAAKIMAGEYPEKEKAEAQQ